MDCEVITRDLWVAKVVYGGNGVVQVVMWWYGRWSVHLYSYSYIDGGVH